MASKYKDQLRKVVTAPFSGIEFSLRRISFGTYMEQMGILPVEASPAVQDQLEQMNTEFKEKARGEKGFAEKAVRFILEFGVASPKIWFGKADDCPEEQVPYEDLGADVMFLSKEITEFSAKPLGLEHFFFGQRADDARLSGETLQPETVQTAAEGNHTEDK